LPDGSAVAFGRGPDGVWQINTDGSAFKQLGDPGFALLDPPSFSPVGTKVLVVNALFPPTQEIYVLDLATGTSLQISDGGVGADRSPAWSPDGRRIAFAAERDGNTDIYTMNTDGTDERRLTTDPGLDDDPEWSPDGRRIAFTSEMDGNTDIWVMDADGSNKERLTSDPAIDLDPSWWAPAVIPIELQVSDTVTAEVMEPGELGWFTFEAEEGAIYTIAVSADSLTDVSLQLWVPHDPAAAPDVELGEGMSGPFIVWPAPSSGHVFVSIGSSSDATGSYRLSLTAVGGGVDQPASGGVTGTGP